MTESMHGEFILTDIEGNEHVVPNHFTVLGMQEVLKGAFWKIDQTWYVGLCAHSPADAIPLANVLEPAMANGYARQSLHLDSLNWPTIGNVNGESFIESRDFTFPLSAPTSIQVNRLFITDGAYVIAISTAFEAGLQFLNGNITAKYRLYFR